jgi:predicted DNA-binding protein
MQQLTIRLPAEYLDRIEQIAKSTGLKKSDIARIAIKKFVEEYGGDEQVDHFSAAKNLIGVVQSGIPDLGQNHRKYLISKIKAVKS